MTHRGLSPAVWAFGCLGVWMFGGLVVVPFVPFVASVPSPQKKEKRFPNRFHRRQPPLPLQRRSGFPTASTEDNLRFLSKGEAVSKPLPQRTTSTSSRSGKDSASPLPRAILPRHAPLPQRHRHPFPSDCPRINTNPNQFVQIREDSWTTLRGLVPNCLGVWMFGCLEVWGFGSCPVRPIRRIRPSPLKRRSGFSTASTEDDLRFLSKGEAVSQPLPQKTTSASSRSGKDSASPLTTLRGRQRTITARPRS